MPKKKTHEEYVLELSERFPDYIALEPYNGSLTKILHRHTTCGHEWEIRPNNILSGKGCPECARKKSHENYSLELAEKRPEYLIVDTYQGALTKVLHEHTTCKYTWYVAPNTLLNGQGCPNCAGNVKKTNEVYKLELLENDLEYVNLEEYKGSHVKISHKHITCGYVWRVAPDHILRGYGCPNCAKTGYNPNLPGTIYLLIITSPDATFFKVGISNRPAQRHKSIARGLPEKYGLEVCGQVEYQDGSIPPILEKLILNKYIKHLDLEKFDGSTELLSFENGYTEIYNDMQSKLL